MKINTQDKALIQINENSVFYKIRRFFITLFNKREQKNGISKEAEHLSSEINNQKNAFIESIKNIETEETKLIKLQKQYNSGELDEKGL